MDNLENMQQFSNIILERVKNHNLDYIDAIVSYCEEINIEIDTIKELISPALKVKLEEDAISLRLIRNNAPRLIC